MISEPWFWRVDSAAAAAMRAALAPAALAYAAGQALRLRLARPVDPGLPVICVGAATLGGAGKTPLALLLRRLLAEAGAPAYFVTRGYGGLATGPRRVDPAKDLAADVGDEALLLAREAPTIVARDRAAGAAAALADGARFAIMDDGFQNPTVMKRCSLLLVDSARRDRETLFPAGPYRERREAAARRADAIILMGDRAEAPFGADRPQFRVRRAISSAAPLGPVAAFCGLARPERFFESLEAAGYRIASRRVFPDHHPYTEEELASLRADAAKIGAPLVTTEKDLVRLSAMDWAGIVPVRLELALDDAAGLTRHVLRRIGVS